MSVTLPPGDSSKVGKVEKTKNNSIDKYELIILQRKLKRIPKCKPVILNTQFTDFNFFDPMILKSIGITEQQNFSDEITRPIEKSVISTK
jgi:hypothetical protein